MLTQTKLRTLRDELHTLIMRHGLSEVLDRLLSMTIDQSDLEDPDFSLQWNALILHLEHATQAALTLTQMKDELDQDLWK